ncbi:hypothetical protein TNCV_2930051 [Trichonephila clavipes]|nr:hypothetical protein TNCV_2930051 [Trichonephila clavipes]
MEIDSNKKTDFLARTAAEEKVRPTGYLTFQLSSLKKIKLHHLGRTPPSHPWYFRRNPRSFKLMPRKYQTTFLYFVSSHIKALTFCQGQKILPECYLCYSELVSFPHLDLLGFQKERDPSGLSSVFRFS